MPIAKRKRLYHGVHAPVAGLMYQMGGTQMSERHTPRCNNVRFKDGVIESNKGMRYFGRTNTTPLHGVLMKLGLYVKGTSSARMIALTDDDAYSYDVAAGHFLNITKGVEVENCEDDWVQSGNVVTAVSTDNWRGTNCLKATVAAAFTTGLVAYENFAAANLTTYTHLHFMIRSDTVTTAGQLELMLDDANGCGSPTENLDVPALAADTWTEVSVVFADATDLGAILSVGLNITGAFTGEVIIDLDDIRATIEQTGDEDDIYSTAVVPDASSPPVDNFIFCNGKDTIKKWDLLTATSIDLVGATALIPKDMLFFGQRLCLYDVTDTANRYRIRVQWPIAGDPEDWTGTGSGAEDLRTQMADGDQIMRALKLGDYAVIYGRKSIALQEYTSESASQPFLFHPRVSNIGLLARQLIINLYGHEHIFAGWENFYSYTGGRNIEKVGDNISDEFFKVINRTYMGRSFATHDSEKGVIRFYVPTGASVRPNEYFELDIKSRTWSRGDAGVLTGEGLFENVPAVTSADKTYDNAVGTYDAQTAAYDDVSIISIPTAKPVPLFGDNNGYVYIGDPNTYDFAGVMVKHRWDSKDWTVGDEYKRHTVDWMELLFEAKGNSVVVYYSEDEGRTWTAIPYEGSITITLQVGDWDLYKVDIEVWSPQVRFSWRNETSEEAFDLRHIGVGYMPSGDMLTSED